jgi:DNA-directed RNA polymerase subunit omega
MLHPSYTDLMSIVNKDIEEGETKIVNSRYSIVLATSKRARQIIDGSNPLVSAKSGEKPLSIAIDELYNEQLKIMAENDHGDFEDSLIDNYLADDDLDLDIDIDSLIEEYIDEDTSEEENLANHGEEE